MNVYEVHECWHINGIKKNGHKKDQRHEMG